MRFKHNAVTLAKQAFLVRLAYIIERVTADEITQKDIAVLVGCSPSLISAIKRQRESAVTLETLMRVADVLRLTYEVVYTSRNGKCVQSVKIESSVDYLNNSPIRVRDTGLCVVNRKAHPVI